MERIKQNFKYNENSKTVIGRSGHCVQPDQLYVKSSAGICNASGGDISYAAKESLHCNSTNTSYHDILSMKNVHNKKQSLEQLTETQRSAGKASKSTTTTNGSVKTVKRHGSQSSNNNSSNNSKNTDDINNKLKFELSKYKKELSEYSSTTKDLEEKYMKINHELTEIQHRHDRFVASRKGNNASETSMDTSSSSGSEYSLKRKFTQLFNREQQQSKLKSTESLSQIEMQLAPHCQLLESAEYFGSTLKQKNSKWHSSFKEHEAPAFGALESEHVDKPGIQDLYKALRSVLDTSSGKNYAFSEGNSELKSLQGTLNTLQNEQAHYRNIIQQQQTCLHDYHSRCIKAQHVMQTQQLEIEKLTKNNKQLEADITNGIDKLRLKIDAKMRDVSQMPQVLRDEQSKFEKVAKENRILSDRLRSLQSDAAQLKQKIEDQARRKQNTIARLKATERDLKIFKNYNTALKNEKRKLSEDVQALREQLDTVQNAGKRSMSRQRDQSEKQRRDLQRKVFELELKLSRSQNSSTGLLQERDTLIAELQTQLNTLVHNFEVSQKHIRVLRRHIYNMSGSNNAPTVRVPGSRINPTAQM